MQGIKKRSSKAGLPPGSLVHIGRKKDQKIAISVMDYNEKQFHEKAVNSAEECQVYRRRSTVTWINLDGIHDPEVMGNLGRVFRLHPLLLEDIMNTEQRPKIDDYKDYIFVVLKMLSYDEVQHQVYMEQVSLVLGDNFVISFQESAGDVFDAVRDRIRKSKGLIRKSRSDYLAYMLLDAVVDNYFFILEKLGERIEQTEEHLTGGEQQEMQASEIHTLKRQLLHLRRTVWPLREVVGSLLRSETKLVRAPTRLYFRDVYDHTIQVIDTIETFRDMASSMVDIYLSSMSNRLNEVMKVLTIIGTIFIPLTFITGIYGMNFRFMPEIDWHYGYFTALGLMAAVAVLMLFYFKKKRWV